MRQLGINRDKQNWEKRSVAEKNVKKPTESPAPVAVPEPKKEVCFVIMPFGGWLDDYYISVYCPAIIAAGLEPHRADDLFRPSTIVNDIWSYPKRSKVLLADLPGKKPKRLLRTWPRSRIGETSNSRCRIDG